MAISWYDHAWPALWAGEQAQEAQTMMSGFDMLGWYFERGIASLSRSLEMAGDAISREMDRELTAKLDYEMQLEKGGPALGLRDDDGILIWDQGILLQSEIESLEDAAMALRKAFAIQLFHFWERSAQEWTHGDANTRFPELVSRSLARGYPIHDRLEAVKRLANALKHGNPRDGKWLVKNWGEIVASGTQRAMAASPETIDWYEAIALTDAHMGEITEIISGSGPVFNVGNRDRDSMKIDL